MLAMLPCDRLSRIYTGRHWETHIPPTFHLGKACWNFYYGLVLSRLVRVLLHLMHTTRKLYTWNGRGHSLSFLTTCVPWFFRYSAWEWCAAGHPDYFTLTPNTTLPPEWTLAVLPPHTLSSTPFQHRYKGLTIEYGSNVAECLGCCNTPEEVDRDPVAATDE